MNTQSNLFNLKPATITMYGAAWCPDCKRAKDFFGKHKIEYENVDVDETPEATPFVKELNNGMRIIPTIIFPNGEILVEPSNAQLAEKFGV
jgi:glutaredoxin-like protein